MNNTDLLLTQKISEGEFSEVELKTFSSVATIYFVRTSLSIENIDFYREEIDYDGAQILLKPIYLQSKSLKISKSKNSSYNFT